MQDLKDQPTAASWLMFPSAQGKGLTFGGLLVSEACECAAPQDVKGQTETMNWLMFQMGGLGPMQGQAVHFVRFASEHVEYGINRYVNETRRLYEVTHGGQELILGCRSTPLYPPKIYNSNHRDV